MKTLFLLLILSITDYSNAQSIKEKLKSAIIGIERENYIQNQSDFRSKYKEQLAQAGDTSSDIRVTSITVDVFSHSLISLKSWWKDLLDAHASWYTAVHDLALDLTETGGKKLDSVAKKQFDEKFEEEWQEKKKKDTSSVDYVKYFKDKYDRTDASVKVYQVFYKVDLEANHDGQYHSDTLKIALYTKSLAEVKSFEYAKIH